MNRATGPRDYDVLVIGSGFAGSITAQAERAMALWPNNGDRDPARLSAWPTSGSCRWRPGIRRCCRLHPRRCSCRPVRFIRPNHDGPERHVSSVWLIGG